MDGFWASMYTFPLHIIRFNCQRFSVNCDDTKIYHFEDLAAWLPSGESLAVVGHPIGHSLSPVMHNAALVEMSGMDARYGSWRYHRFDIAPDCLGKALKCFYDKNFRGLNLTVPHKVLALDSLVYTSEKARRIGAVNTLVRSEEGWCGYNTDAYGLAEGIKESLGLSLESAQVLLLGCGGAARAALVECISRGCSSVTVVNRTRSKMEDFIREFLPYAEDCGVELRGLSPNEIREAGLSGRLLVNATSLGLGKEDPAPIDLSCLREVRAVFDMIYNPQETALLRQAREHEIPSANGLAMLLYQGVRALELWSGEKAPVETMRSVLLKALNC